MNPAKTFFLPALIVVTLGVFLTLHAQSSNPQSQPTPAQAAQSRSVLEGVYTEKQAQRGEELYHHLCAFCHGEKLSGKDSDSVPALTGRAFEWDWNSGKLLDLFKEIRRKMPQNDPGTLTPQQSADLVAFVLSFNKLPSGQTELPSDDETLRNIRVEFKKPDQQPGASEAK